MRRTAPRPISVAVAQLSARLAPSTPLAAIQHGWAEAVGEAIAREAEPVAERSGVVTVCCRSAVWAQELDLMSVELVQRLNDVLGRPVVTALHCIAGGMR